VLIVDADPLAKNLPMYSMLVCCIGVIPSDLIVEVLEEAIAESKSKDETGADPDLINGGVALTASISLFI
jgi:hypothetical protein